MQVDPTIQEATRRAIYRASGGLQVTFTRQTGIAPAATFVAATVTALVRDYRIDTQEIAQEGFKPTSPGAITQGDREILVMADDLATAGFPLPLLKGDNIVAETGERMNIVSVDARKRTIAGCIEIKASGV
ncbi:MAG: hypothetical protein QM651_16010 [Rhodoblastus sp.]